MNTIRKNKLFHREEMQQLGSREILKVVVIAGIIVIPLLIGLVV